MSNVFRNPCSFRRKPTKSLDILAYLANPHKKESRGTLDRLFTKALLYQLSYLGVNLCDFCLILFPFL